MLRPKIDKLIRRFEHGYDTFNRIEVSKSALITNLRFFQEQYQQVIPVLKGNAYGHGIELVAKAIASENIPYIAVDGYFEALRVRNVCSTPVLVMGMILPANYKNLRIRDFAFVVQDEATLYALAALHKNCKIHLEINTGMHRNGIAADDLAIYLKLIKMHPKLKLEGIMSHLADADGTNARTLSKATKVFDDCVAKILAQGMTPRFIHIAQTAGSLRPHSVYANTMRLGIGLYGINPFHSSHPKFKSLTSLQPVLQLISTVSRVNSVQKGDGIGYNYTYKATQDMHVAVLPMGYYEGVPRALSNKGVVKYGSEYLPIVGRVCMNHTIVSLKFAGARVGDKVIVISSHTKDRNSVQSLADNYGIFTYDLLAGLASDVRRILVA